MRLTIDVRRDRLTGLLASRIKFYNIDIVSTWSTRLNTRRRRFQVEAADPHSFGHRVLLVHRAEAHSHADTTSGPMVENGRALSEIL